MKCVPCINIGRLEAKEYGYIAYWLISSRIANCFELTATLSYIMNFSARLERWSNFEKMRFNFWGWLNIITTKMAKMETNDVIYI